MQGCDEIIMTAMTDNPDAGEQRSGWLSVLLHNTEWKGKVNMQHIEPKIFVTRGIDDVIMQVIRGVMHFANDDLPWIGCHRQLLTAFAVIFLHPVYTRLCLSHSYFVN